MVITRLELHRFKRFKKVDLEFRAGLNIVFGPNEAGKSSLRQAILAALFGNPTGTGDPLCNSWGEAERPAIKLNFVDHQGRECQLRKDFAEQKVFLLAGEESYKTRSAVQNLLNEELGFTNEEFYNLCTSLDVRSLANLGNPASRKQVGKKLAEMMTGSVSGDDVFSVIKRLDEAQRDLNKGLQSPAKTPGPLKQARDLLAQLNAQRSEAERILAERQNLETSRQTLSAALEQGRRRLEHLGHVLQANRELAEARKKKLELAEADARFDQAEQNRKRKAAELADLDERIAARAVHVLGTQDIETLRVLVDARSKLEQTRPVSPSAPSAMLPLAFAAAFGLAGLLFLLWSGVLGWVTLGASTVLLVLGMQIRGRSRAETLKYTRDMEIFQKEQSQLEQRISLITERVSGQTPDEIFAAWPETHQWIAQRDALVRQLQEAGPIDQEKWKQVRMQLRVALDVCEDPALLKAELSGPDQLQMQREHDRLVGNLEDLERQKIKTETLLAQGQPAAERLLGLTESDSELRDRIAYLEKSDRILRLARDFLEMARRDTLFPARELLEKRAGELLAEFTARRYQRIMLDDEDLSCKVFVPGTARWEDPLVLSQGTFDQLYLSLRLSLSEILSGGKRPPLLLDEPFAAFDDERRSLAMDSIRRLAKDRQILMFTCREEYLSQGDHALVLEQADKVS